MFNLDTAMRRMKSNRSPGYDELTTDMIKAAGPIGTQWLYWVLRRIWTENNIPEDWYKGIIIPIYKKGGRKQCGNYRGTTLLCQTFKIYERILANQIIKEIKGQLAEELYAFRAGRATTDLIFEIRQLIEKNWEYGNEFLMLFIDYKKPSDSVKREKICKSLEKIGIAADLLGKVKNTYKRAINCVKTNKVWSACFETSKTKKRFIADNV
jgi:hypothetical protein